MSRTPTALAAGSRRLLVVDDDAVLLRLVSSQLMARGFEVTPFTSADSALTAAAEHTFDAAVIDYSLQGTTGIALLEALRTMDPTLACVLLSGTIDVPESVRAIRLGAEDVQVKPPSIELLVAALERGIERTYLQRSRRLLAVHVSDPYGVLDPSPAMQRVLRQAERAARFAMPVLLVGEAGTGKRAIAEMVHQLSPQSDNPLQVIGLRDRSADEIEEALRAIVIPRLSARYVAPTSLYLDELSTLNGASQQLLLDACQSVHFKLLASTRRDLMDDVRAGLLGADLQQRLAAFTIAIPALGERGAGAIRTLATRTLGRLRNEVGEGPDAFAESTLEWLCNCRWPGNIPQLRDVIGESFIRAIGHASIDTHHLAPSLVSRGLLAGSVESAQEDWSLTSAERRHILSVLGMAKQNRSLAARLLGITRTTLYKKMAEYGVHDTE